MNNKPVPEVSLSTKPYWDAAQEGKLKIQRCSSCAAYVFYPRPWCPACLSLKLEWTEVSGRGEVITYTIMYQPSFEAYASSVPYILAVIHLAEGPQMMANVLNCPLDAVRVGLPVKVTFEERQSGFKVPQFEPA